MSKQKWPNPRQPNALHDDVHETPETAAMEATGMERENADVSWTRPSALDAPPARPGMVQRWIRTELGGDPDPRNLQKAMREGWRPVRAETVPESYRPMSVKMSGQGDVIGVQGLILCEMPSKAARQRNAFYDQQSARQQESVDRDLMKVQRPGEPINVDHTSRVERGRRPSVAAD